MRSHKIYLVTVLSLVLTAVAGMTRAASYSIMPVDFANEVRGSASTPGLVEAITDSFHDEAWFAANGTANASFLGSNAWSNGYMSFSTLPGPTGFSIATQLGAGGTSPTFTASADAVTGKTNGYFDFFTPAGWTITVQHGDEAPGTPFLVTVSSSVSGSLTAQAGSFFGTASSSADWSVAVNGGFIMANFDRIDASFASTGGTKTFADNGSYSFIVPDGGNFALVARYGVDVNRGGNSPGAGASLDALFGIDITPVPVPPAIWLLASGLIGLAGVTRRFRKSQALKGSD